MGMPMIEALIDRLMNREGGYVDHPDDRGGPTNYGITQAALADWRGKPASASDVQDLSPGEAREIYRNRYWTAPGFDRLDLPDLLVEAIFDTGVHSGPRRAVQILQRAAGTEDDGIIGQLTIRACDRTPARRLVARFLAQRGLFLGYLVGRDPSQQAFRDGWANRLAELVERMDEA